MSPRTRGEQITAWQLFLLEYGLVVASAQLYLIGVSARAAGRDAWLVAPLAALAGLAVLALLLGLQRRYPGESLVAAARRLPPVLRQLVPLPFLLWLTHSTGVLTNEFAQFIGTTLLPLAPKALILLPGMVVGAYAVYLGVETMGRMAELLIPPMAVISGLILLLTLPEFSLRNLQPVLLDGPLPVVRASLVPAAWYAELVMLGQIQPHLAKVDRLARVSLAGWLAVTLALFLMGVGTLGVWGLLAGRLMFPFYSLGTLVELGEFLPRFDVISTALWTGGMFVKFMVFFYVTVSGWADWLGLDDHRPLVPWVGAASAVVALATLRGEAAMLAYLRGLFPPLTLGVALGTPLLILLLGRRVAAARPARGEGPAAGG
ncbi:MAG: endospore germination permease [Clostridia bacterium]|nr:endospore germination permease [Clostridia bacterium]